MASFNALETSVEESRPIELYTFAIGSATYRYTSSQDAITIGSSTWSPTAISRGGISQGIDSRRQELSVTVPGSNPVAQLYRTVPPSARATLTIIRLQRDETPSLQEIMIFKGRVKAVQYSEDNQIASIIVQSLESSMQRMMPRFVYSGMCNHILYDTGCGADPAGFNVIGAVSSMSTSGMTFDIAGASGLDLIGGYVKPTTADEFRLITGQSGNSVTILLPFTIEVDGQDVQAFAGCDHLVTGDCANVFDNVLEFSGFAWVPNKNIFETGL
jgi:hypothetical protein